MPSTATAALSHSVCQATWRDALRMKPADATVGPALRVGVGVAIALITGGLLGYPMLGAVAALGAVTAAFCRHQPMPLLAPRLVIYAGMSVVFAFLGSAMSAAATPIVAQLSVFSVCAGLATHLLNAFEITGPGPVVLLLGASAAAGPSQTFADVPAVTAAAAAGAALGLITALSPRILHPMGAARLAVARALTTVGRLEVLDRASVDDRAVADARNALAHAHAMVAYSSPTSQHARALTAVLVEADAAVEDWLADTASHRIDSVTRHASGLRKIRRMDPTILSSKSNAGPAHPVEVPRPLLATAVAAMRSRTLIATAVRTTVAAAFASLAAHGLGLTHPMWAMFGAVAALQGLTHTRTVERGIQRALGNAAGAMVAIVVIAAGPHYWHLVVGIVVLQILAELWAPRQYALTSMALGVATVLIVAIGTEIGPGVALDRAADTVVGVVVGIVISALTLDHSDPFHTRAG